MKSILVSIILVCFVGPITFNEGQERRREDNGAARTEEGKSTNDQIDVNTDRFSKKTTLVLKPQIMIDKPDHFVTLTIKTQVGKSDDPRLEVSSYSMLHVASQARVPPDFGDNKLYFLVDDKPLDIEYSTISDIPDSLDAKYYIEKGNLPRKRTFSYYVYDPSFANLSKAENIEMKLGPFELKLSNSVTANLREYGKQVLAQYKIAKEKKP